MKNPFKPFSGFEDRFGPEVRKRKLIEQELAEQFQLAGYEPIEVPLVEKKNFFAKKYLGSSPWPSFDEKSLFQVDVIDYYKNYQKGNKVTKGIIIPEGTTSVCRWISNLLTDREKRIKELLPLKLYYTLTCLRNELIHDLSPGKMREFRHVGLEIFGPRSYMADVEVLYLLSQGLESVGVPKTRLNVRLGDVRIFNYLCRKHKIGQKEQDVLKKRLDNLSRIKPKHDMKAIVETEKEIEFFLRKFNLKKGNIELWKKLYFFRERGLEETLKIIKSGLATEKIFYTLASIAKMLRFLKIPFKIDPCIVRGQEYYTDTVFEVDARGDNNVEIIAGGGRYNSLVQRLLGHKFIKIPATGFACSIERIINILKDNDINKAALRIVYFLNENSADYVVFPRNIKKSWLTIEKMRNKGQRVDLYLLDKDEENAKKYTERIGAKFLKL